MKTIFDNSVPMSQFEKVMTKIQTKVLIGGLIFFASIVVRLIFNF